MSKKVKSLLRWDERLQRVVCERCFATVSHNPKDVNISHTCGFPCECCGEWIISEKAEDPCHYCGHTPD